MTRGLQRHLPWLAAFLLSANLYLVPPAASSPRATDLVGACLGVWALLQLARGRLSLRHLIMAGLGLLPPLAWVFFGSLAGDAAAVVQAVRWVLAVPWALALMSLLDCEDRRRRFAWGLLAGGAVNVAVIVLQVLGFEQMLQVVGLSSSGAAYNNYVLQSVRFPGLHGYHNASAAVVSLMAPAAVYLYFRREGSLAVLLGSLAGMAVAFHLTSTRSPLVVLLATIAYAAVAARRFTRIAVIALVLLVLALPPVVVYGPPGGWSRWRDADAVSSNVHERLQSNAGAVRVAVERPFGSGVTASRDALIDLTGIAATHNAFLQAAVVFGLPFALLLLAGSLGAIRGGLEGVDSPRLLPGVLACQAFGLFLFEEHFNNPTFIVLAMWWVVLLGWRARPGRTAPAEGSRAEDLPPVD